MPGRLFKFERFEPLIGQLIGYWPCWSFCSKLSALSEVSILRVVACEIQLDFDGKIGNGNVRCEFAVVGMG